ncbi:MAG: hypothetical protein ACE5JB_06090 [bacterium]
MCEAIDDTRDTIELKLTLNVILGNLEESIAEVWKDAIRKLDDEEISQLTWLAQRYPSSKFSSIMLKFLMNKSYPFKEMILYQTDENFKRRMGIDDLEKEEWF